MKSTDPEEIFDKESPDDNRETKKLPYPKSVFFIVSNEFCERFSYYGMRTILVIYLTNILLYSEADAKIVYHTFTMFVYFFPVLGAILSDSYLGKFNTILYVSMIYAAGSILLALASAEPVGLPQNEFSIVGLLLIAIGTGGIKPCVSAFGGDQFILPQQEMQLALFFSLFYFSINAGSLISTFLTPVLRNDVHCFGQDSCFPLAFAVPGVLMIMSIVIFACGKPIYKVKRPEGNVVVKVAKCITYAVRNKISSNEKKDHWMDYAEDKYGVKLVDDIKATLHVLVLYLPLPIFWALYDQQGSGWTFQAVRMNGDIGFYTILPDQVQVVNPLLILAFIPLFTYSIYPMLARCGLLKTSLQRMTCGGFLAAVAFAVSAVVSIALESTYPVLPSPGNIQLRIYNPSACDLSVDAPELNLSISKVAPLGYYENKYIDFQGSKNVSFLLKSDCLTLAKEMEVPLEEQNAFGISFTKDGHFWYKDSVAKSEDGYPKVRTLDYMNRAITYKMDSNSLTVDAGNHSLKSVPRPGTYTIEKSDDTSLMVDLKLGGTYTVMINDDSTARISSITITEPNSVHILWLLPQYFIITAAEIMFSITGLEFSYSQAPSTMKSLLQACFLLTTAFGNLIIVIIESAKIFEKQSNDFFLYTGLMVADMLIFTYMAMKYKYVTLNNMQTTF
ncbi:unnamed protein product [Phaedon cochleariae]|uniref:Oligopeptide transporter 1 n=1 Tax=Phaedon cochleariae TaxID=80249 RepID=A0A9N9SIQ7_PHACE|nr:unnamed protein product [Phaedon cochleariae]